MNAFFLIFLQIGNKYTYNLVKIKNDQLILNKEMGFLFTISKFKCEYYLTLEIIEIRFYRFYSRNIYTIWSLTSTLINCFSDAKQQYTNYTVCP